MGLSFGGKSGTMSKEDLTKNVKQAESYLFGAINPGLAKGAVGDMLQGGPQVGSALQGIPGVLTYDQYGKPQPVGSNALPSLLPKFVDIGTFNTVFEKVDSGALSPSAKAMFDNFMSAATTSKIGGGGGGGIGGGGGLGGGSVDYTKPENIGKLTSDIIKSLPSEFQTFISNTLNASSPERTQQVMNEFEESLTARSLQHASGLSEDIMDSFSAQGLASSGSAIESMKEMGVAIATELNATIAAGKIQLLEQQLQAMSIGEELTNDLLTAGANEQAHLVALETQKMAANASIISSQIAAAASVQQTLIATQAQLEGQRLALLGTGFEALVNQSSAEEQARINSLIMPYNVMAGIMQGPLPVQNKSGTGIDLNGIISGAGSIIGGGMVAGAIGNAAKSTV